MEKLRTLLPPEEQREAFEKRLREKELEYIHSDPSFAGKYAAQLSQSGTLVDVRNNVDTKIHPATLIMDLEVHKRLRMEVELEMRRSMA